MKTFKTPYFILGLAMVPAMAFAQLGKAYVQLDTVYQADGEALSNPLYVNLPYKLTDTKTFVPEFRGTLFYKDDNVSKTKLTHDFLRAGINDKGFEKLGVFDLGVLYRYALPTTIADQKAGTFGKFTIRPTLSGKFGEFSLGIRYGASVNLVRDAVSVNETPAKALSLYSGSLEFIPSYDFSEDLGVNADLAFSHSYKGRAATGKKFSQVFYHYYDVTYAVAALDLKASLYTEHESAFGTKGSKFKFYSDKANIGLALAKTF
jgi:hypothetical protein